MDIDIEAGGYRFKEDFTYDILNPDNVPEEISAVFVRENRLPQHFVVLISQEIRKKIFLFYLKALSALERSLVRYGWI